MINWDLLKTADRRAAEALERARAARSAAYRAESDPLRLEAEYDARSSGQPVDYSHWLAKVAEIKARIPLPTGSD